ncbi:MAG: hypothetical protein B7X34_09995 [Acidobacteriia bacterium 12-62-4]|nr:MAG: hypothetical protein B7X34_09995 [Acidobacteriia bacterium 12-62-4]
MDSLNGAWLNRVCDPAEMTLGAAVAQALLAARSHPEVVDVLLTRLRVESEPGVVDRLLELLGAVTPAERINDVLQPYINSDNPRIRSKALKLYACATGDAQWAMQFLGHSDSRFTANVVEALWGAKSTPDLREFFWAACGSPNGRVAGNAVVGLFHLGDPRAIDVLRRLCRDESPNVRASAAWVIGTVGWIEGMDIAVEMMKDPNPKVQRNAIQVVRRLQTLAGTAKRAPASPTR